MSIPEAVRLVIWDLDGTFWTGTVTEGGLHRRDDAEHAVRTLAARGIISAICSKNEPGVIDDILRQRGMQDFFVFNSISWAPKGPRLAALIAAIQLRPENVLFIDDNPANLAEATHFVPGIQVAAETLIPRLLDDARCQGKPDPDLTRLRQYQTLQIRQRERERERENHIPAMPRNFCGAARSRSNSNTTSARMPRGRSSSSTGPTSSISPRSGCRKTLAPQNAS